MVVDSTLLAVTANDVLLGICLAQFVMPRVGVTLLVKPYTSFRNSVFSYDGGGSLPFFFA